MLVLSHAAEVGDFIKVDGRPIRVIEIVEYLTMNEYYLENGDVLSDSDFTIEDVLLESEVV